MLPRVGRRAFIPARFLDNINVEEARKCLMFSERITTRMAAILHSHDPKSFDLNAKVAEINEFLRVRGGYSLPRAWATKHFPHLPWQDGTAFPSHDIRMPANVISPRDKQQRKFF